MNIALRLLKIIVYPSLLILVAAMLLSVGVSLYLDITRPFQLLVPFITTTLSMGSIYLLPSIAIVGAPTYLLARRWGGRGISSVLAAVATAMMAEVSFPAVEQCITSYTVRREVLSELSASDALKLTTPPTLMDDFEEAKTHIPSRMCPTYFEYKKEGHPHNISINNGEVFRSKGAAQ